MCVPRDRWPSASRHPVRNAARGLTLVELLIGTALGLLIVAGCIGLVGGELRENHALLREARLMQDLRTAADLVTRDLRRAGFWGAAEAGVWSAGASAVLPNPYATVAPDTAASDAVEFRYSRDASEDHTVDSNEAFGFRLRNGAVEMQLGAGNWQALTDSGTVAITVFDVVPTVQQVVLTDLCSTPCPASSPTCPPRLSVRSFTLVLTGHATTDATVVRSVRSSVRLRNDQVLGTCAT